MRSAALVLLLGLTSLLTVNASNLTGRWEGKMAGPDGDEMTITFTFKVEGEKLTGSVEGPAGELPISEGKVKGDEISFKVELNDTAITHQGKVSGDNIALKVQGPWGASEMALKRLAEK
jgi:hypothetical protein